MFYSLFQFYKTDEFLRQLLRLSVFFIFLFIYFFFFLYSERSFMTESSSLSVTRLSDHQTENTRLSDVQNMTVNQIINHQLNTSKLLSSWLIDLKWYVYICGFKYKDIPSYTTKTHAHTYSCRLHSRIKLAQFHCQMPGLTIRVIRKVYPRCSIYTSLQPTL